MQPRVGDTHRDSSLPSNKDAGADRDSTQCRNDDTLVLQSIERGHKGYRERERERERERGRKREGERERERERERK